VRLVCCAGVVLALVVAWPAAARTEGCVVPRVVGLHVVAAKIYVQAAGCRVGRVVRVGSVTVQRRRVLSQRPRGGRRLPEHARVDLVVSSGSPKR
jgi:beta-lactam-binding protein with PASTA domain